ncbi:MAG: aldolase/citrate lyase family protein [Armatimonadota bacterium]|nr:aldolase/citrate lyase family protein [Armatimonadota bacterium]MDR7611755.1 aldolase/citrate lyase family protein [Armatimonadota bacterium]
MLAEDLRAGRTVVGTWLMGPCPSQVEMLAAAGFDFVVLDTEHGSYGVEAAESLVRAADAAGLAALIRVQDLAPAPIAKALDFGAQGVVVPHVDTAEEARRAVRAVCFPPRGVRSGAPTVRAARYGFLPWREYVDRASRSTVLVVQVEGAEGLARLDDILRVDGVGVVFIGTFDLAASTGVPGILDHPALLERVGEIVARARRHGVAVGLWMPTPEQARPWLTRGVQMVTVSNTDLIFADACRTLVRRIRGNPSDPTPEGR